MMDPPKRLIFEIKVVNDTHRKVNLTTAERIYFYSPLEILISLSTRLFNPLTSSPSPPVDASIIQQQPRVSNLPPLFRATNHLSSTKASSLSSTTLSSEEETLFLEQEDRDRTRAVSWWFFSLPPFLSLSLFLIARIPFFFSFSFPTRKHAPEATQHRGEGRGEKRERKGGSCELGSEVRDA